MSGFGYLVVLVVGGCAGALVTYFRMRAKSGLQGSATAHGVQKAFSAIHTLINRDRRAEQELVELLSSVQSKRQGASQPQGMTQDVEAAAGQPALPNEDRFAELAERLLGQLQQTQQDLDKHMTDLVVALELRIDPITQLANRYDVDRWTQILLALMSRYGNEFSVAVIDVDHFLERSANLSENDSRELLCQVAQCIRKAVRETDIVARYGHDEFVVLMPETDLDGANAFSERVRVNVDGDVRMTVSVGVAAALGGDNTRTLLTRADAALYAAKAAGRNAVYSHTGLNIREYQGRTMRTNGAASTGAAPDSYQTPLAGS